MRGGAELVDVSMLETQILGLTYYPVGLSTRCSAGRGATREAIDRPRDRPRQGQAAWSTSDAGRPSSGSTCAR